MIEVVIAYDNLDLRLGQYFTRCKADLMTTIALESAKGLEFPIHEVESKNCHLAYLELALSRLKDLPFIMVAYTHGTEDSLMANEMVFLKSGQDNSFFKGSFFYSTSCLSGKTLGSNLIEFGCRVFIGYEEPVFAFKDERMNVSLTCDNLGMTLFLTSDVTAFEAFSEMKRYFSTVGMRQLQFGDILAAGLIVNAREALVFHGDMNATRKDFQQCC